MTGQNTRIERDTDSGRTSEPGAAEESAEVSSEKSAGGVSNTVAPPRARLNNRVIIEFAAMAVAIAAIAYLYFHH
jgi:hypothetical protein